jgi:hypothetical protein
MSLSSSFVNPAFNMDFSIPTSMDDGVENGMGNGMSLAMLLSAEENGLWDWNIFTQLSDPWSINFFDFGHGRPSSATGIDNSTTINPSALFLPNLSPDMATAGMKGNSTVEDQPFPTAKETIDQDEKPLPS